MITVERQKGVNMEEVKMSDATRIWMDLASFRAKNEMMTIWRKFTGEMADLIFDDPMRDSQFQHELWDKIMDFDSEMSGCISKSCGGTYEEYCKNN